VCCVCVGLHGCVADRGHNVQTRLVHRDLKLDNICITINWPPKADEAPPAHGEVGVKIIDWGEAVLEGTSCKNGPCGVKSLECFEKDGKDDLQESARDVYQCGVMLLQMIRPQVIFGKKQELRDFCDMSFNDKLEWLKTTRLLTNEQIVRGRVPTTCTNFPPNPVNCPCDADTHFCDDLRDLVAKMLDKKAGRIALEDVLRHPWFTRQHYPMDPREFTRLMAQHLAPSTAPASSVNKAAGKAGGYGVTDPGYDVTDPSPDLVDRALPDHLVDKASPAPRPESTISASTLRPGTPIETCTFFYTRVPLAQIFAAVTDFLHREFTSQRVESPESIAQEDAPLNCYAKQNRGEGTVVHARFKLPKGSPFVASPFGTLAPQVGLAQFWLRVFQQDDGHEGLLMVQMDHVAGDYAVFLHVFRLIEKLFTHPRCDVRSLLSDH
jgi:serine/threonine protein kinase